MQEANIHQEMKQLQRDYIRKSIIAILATAPVAVFLSFVLLPDLWMTGPLVVIVTWLVMTNAITKRMMELPKSMPVRPATVPYDPNAPSMTQEIADRSARIEQYFKRPKVQVAFWGGIVAVMLLPMTLLAIPGAELYGWMITTAVVGVTLGFALVLSAFFVRTSDVAERSNGDPTPWWPAVLKASRIGAWVVSLIALGLTVYLIATTPQYGVSLAAGIALGLAVARALTRSLQRNMAGEESI